MLHYRKLPIRKQSEMISGQNVLRFFLFGFKLNSIFGKPEHLDFASLLAKGK